MEIDKKQAASILNDLADLVDFYERQSAEGLIDGAHDPYAAVQRAKMVLDESVPNWRNGGYAAAV
ncbi:hypothetical protein [Zhongshania sp.]|uniref:hypothetical protein n=1 Tax=Zhongshania sp. TaxID=1971902 RepID=UPI003567C785